MCHFLHPETSFPNLGLTSSHLFIGVGSYTDSKVNMADYEGDEMDHVADDNEMEEVDEIMYFRGRVIGDSESDDDDDDEYDTLVSFLYMIHIEY